jgi:nicotinamide-nucleotide adenylyltransferase
MIDIGVIHGRFQVLHNDHLKYLLAGKARCSHLVVGITNPEPRDRKTDAADPHRDEPAANPLSWWERAVMVRAALAERGVPASDLTIVPLPIHDPERYRNYVPMDAVFFLTIYDDWGRKKLARFQSLGLKTEVLREVLPQEKGISGCEVRDRIAKDKKWDHLVPPAVAELVRRWEIADRLRRLHSSAETGK